MSIPVKVTDASVRECVLYANLLLRGEDTDQIGTSLTVEISDALDRLARAREVYQMWCDQTVDNCSDEMEMLLADISEALEGETDYEA